MKRILIHEDKGLFEKIKKDLHTFYPLLEKMKTSYELLELGTFKNEVMEVLKAKGANQIEVEFYENIASQLDKSGITSKSMRQTLINGNTSLILEFKISFSGAKDFKINQPPGLNQWPTLDFNLISFNDDSKTFQVDATAEAEILETYCRIYLDSENEKKIYDSLLNFVRAQGRVRESLKEVGYTFQREGFELNGIIQNFLTTSPEVSIKPDAIKFAVNQKNILEQRSNLMKNIRANGN